MSTTRQPFVDDRQTDHDPYDIVPEGFLAAYNASSIPEALRKAEKAPSTTPESEQPRCEYCGSTKIISKPGHRDIPNKVQDKPFKCDECGEHLESRAPSLDEAMPGEQSTLGELSQ